MTQGNGFYAEKMIRRRALSLIGGSMARLRHRVSFSLLALALGRPKIIFSYPCSTKGPRAGRTWLWITPNPREYEHKNRPRV